MDKRLQLGMAKEHASLYQQDDPWDLPPYFLLRKNKWKSLRTHSGYWKEKEEELTAIRSTGESSSSSTASPSYVGVRKTLEFYLKDGTRGGEGTKTDWIIHEYYDLRKDDDGEALLLQEDVVLRKVFRKSKNKADQASSLYHQVDSCVKSYKEQKQALSKKERKQVYDCSHGNYGNKDDTFFGTEELDLLSIAHRRPQYLDAFFGLLTDDLGVLNEDLGDLAVQNADLGDSGVQNEDLGVLNEHLGVRNEDLVVQNEDLGVLNEDLRDLVVQNEDLGVLNEDLGVWTEDLGVRNEDLGVLNEDLGVWNKYLAVQNEDLGDLEVHNEDLDVLNDNLRALNGDLRVQNEAIGGPYRIAYGLYKGVQKPVKVWEYFTKDVWYSKVWKHFTKIRSSNHPDEVYAACHRCDKVFKAHSKKHGTSHLIRHIRTCSSCTNPSTNEDREMLHRLRTVLNNPDEQQKMEVKLDCQEDLTQLDPWDLSLAHPTPWYVTRSSNRQTQGGHWEEIKNEFTVIRKDQHQMQRCWEDIHKEITVVQMDHQFQVQVPEYIGMRRTLQFQDQDGKKMDWIMHEYQHINDIESPTLFLQEDMVIRKVFRYDKDVVASAFSDLDRWLNGDNDNDEYFNGDVLNTDITTPSNYVDTTTSSSDYIDTPVDRKRKRTGAASRHKSEVWMHFTKIHNKDHGVVYVVCHTCDRGYGSGRSTNGTSHLWRHNKSCSSKHRRTGDANDASTEWEAEIWPLFLVFKTYGETDHQPSGMC